MTYFELIGVIRGNTMKRMKIIAFITLLVCLSIAVPASFAVDDDIAIAISDNQDSSISDDVLGSNDYYFNASVENDTGSGSIDNPYKELTTDRIKDNSILHLADGEYDLGFYFSKSANNVTIIGQNVEKTVISYSGKNFPNFRVTNSLTLQNVTLINLVIDDSYNAIVNANNVIFKNSKSSPISVELANTVVNLTRCTFINNTADFGPIFIRDGTLNINDSLFLNNYATFGGAITSIEARLIITNITYVFIFPYFFFLKNLQPHERLCRRYPLYGSGTCLAHDGDIAGYCRPEKAGF